MPDSAADEVWAAEVEAAPGPPAPSDLDDLGLDDLGSSDALREALLAIGARRYHALHPFHRLLHEGRLSRGQVQAWALNRYYYQSRIPMKDCALMARITDPALRSEWAQRVVDHDGSREGPGGVERWLGLCEALGLDRELVASERALLPATRHAGDAYVAYVSRAPLLQAVASSLTELFAPTIIRDRVAGMLANYDFVDEAALAYFRPRLSQAPRDADFALDWAAARATSPRLRRAVCDALLFKCDLLWAQLDALHNAYVEGAGPPPGAFVPEPS